MPSFSQDIALDVVDLLRELTDADNNLDEEESQVLLKGLVSFLLSLPPFEKELPNSNLHAHVLIEDGQLAARTGCDQFEADE